MEDQKIVPDSTNKIDPVKVIQDIEEKAKKSKDVKTTIAGTIMAISTGLLSVPGPHTIIAGIVAGISGSLFAYWSKDK